jgi:hypothetical protein
MGKEKPASTLNPDPCWKDGKPQDIIDKLSDPVQVPGKKVVKREAKNHGFGFVSHLKLNPKNKEKLKILE